LSPVGFDKEEKTFKRRVSPMSMIRRGVAYYYNITDGRRAAAAAAAADDEREKGTALTVALRSADKK